MTTPRTSEPTTSSPPSDPTYYLVLLHDTESDASIPGSPEWDADLADYAAFDERAGDAVVGGEALQPSERAIVVQPSTGTVTDGPFAETVEVVGGYYVLAAGDLDHALDLAAAIPAARTGTLEVRPISSDWTPPATAPDGATSYLALLRGEPMAEDVKGSPEWEAAIAAHQRFVDAHVEQVLGGAELHLPETATTVRVRGGEVQLTDGPFAETTEIVGGFYVFWATSRAEAVSIASDIPMGDGTIELRPIVTFDG